MKFIYGDEDNSLDQITVACPGLILILSNLILWRAVPRGGATGVATRTARLGPDSDLSRAPLDLLCSPNADTAQPAHTLRPHHGSTTSM
jgi:hypothetical protein